MSSNKPARSRKKKAGTPAPGPDKPLCVVESDCKLGQQQAVCKTIFHFLILSDVQMSPQRRPF